MSNYEPIVPTTIPFDFHGASIEIETEDSREGGIEDNITLLKTARIIQNWLPHIL